MINYDKKQQLQLEKENVRQYLIKLFDEVGHEVYIELLHVSKSGMLRSINVYAKNGVNITGMVAKLLCYNFHKSGGLRVTGCGMDMGFHVVYTLSVALYCKDKYTHNGAYKLSHRWVN